uniref:meprin A subunit beta-like n=1 Tax=Styela clava TaxID=7725 RepID=UPI0019397314|nr:meprin A subunit beta-like [Styela clava]
MRFIILLLLTFIIGANCKYIASAGEKKSYAEQGVQNEYTIEKQTEKLSTIDVGVHPGILKVNEESGVLDELLEGDIIKPKKETRNTILDEFTELFWPTKFIPVAFANGTNLFGRAAIDEARREYELRTCLSFPARTNETNHITFRRLNGCFSSIGMQGGGQVISIGDRCEEMYTVQHEMMHAIGIWHEQSRADRDEYVQIMWGDITPNTVNNFNNYDYTEIDNRRIAYDFDSVMHYGKTAFTKNGNNTIRTRDPKFQDVIGQQSTFSPGDVIKINRMYDCSDTVRITNSVNFEETNAGGYAMEDSDTMWLRHNIDTSDASGPTTKYLPKFDSSFGQEGTGSFMYLDTSSKFPGLTGQMKSMRYATTVARQCLEFSHYINLNDESGASMALYLASIDPITGEITSYGDPLMTFGGKYLGTHESEWNVERMTISAPEVFRLVFWAKTGGYYNDIIAIDDVSIVDKECDSSYFMIPQYSSLLESYSVDEYSASHIMYTGNPGYAFQLLIYPNGQQSAIDEGYEDYMAIYFRLVGGKYDNELEWPFDKQFVRIVVTDQGPNPLTRMNYYLNFLTDATSLDFAAFRQPGGLGSFNNAVGYSHYISNTRLTTSVGRRYLKHDVLYLSVQVTDMRPFENGSNEISAQLRNPVIRNARDLQPLLTPEVYETSDQEPMKKESDAEDFKEETNNNNNNKGMITVKTTVIIVVTLSSMIFLFMAFLICAVASSNSNKMKQVPTVQNNISHEPRYVINHSYGYGDEGI